jgi:hypothetical protein
MKEKKEKKSMPMEDLDKVAGGTSEKGIIPDEYADSAKSKKKHHHHYCEADKKDNLSKLHLDTD